MQYPDWILARTTGRCGRFWRCCCYCRDDNIWSQPGTNTYQLLSCNITGETSTTSSTTAAAVTTSAESTSATTTTGTTTTTTTTTTPATPTSADAERSCAGQCDELYVEGKSCYCNIICGYHNDCCSDYVDHCPYRSCENAAWIKTENETRLGASSFFLAGVVPACLFGCGADPNCLGVDVDYAIYPIKCWPHTNQDDYRDDNIYSQPGTDTYRLLGCNLTTATSTTTTTTTTTSPTTTSSTSSPSTSTSTTSSTTTTTTSTTTTTTTPSTTTTTTTPTTTTTTTPTTTTTTTPRFECIAGWRPARRDQSMPGGFSDRALTLADCQATCAQRYPNCVAINVVPLPSDLISCYLVPRIQQLVPTTNSDYYQAIIADDERCQVTGPTLPPVYECWLQEMIGANWDAGMIVASNVAPLTCACLCANSTVCEAVDYSVGDRSCFLHNRIVGRQPAPCCIRYEYTCNHEGPCRENFQELPGYIPADFSEGMMRYGVRSAANCENECWRESTCSRFVFVTDTQLIGDPNRVCYLFSGRDTTFIERPGGTLYFRRRCLPLDTCAAMTTTTVTPPADYCAMDLMILLDSSGSVRENQPPDAMGDNWNASKAFVNDVLRRGTRIGRYYDRVALIQFSTQAILRFDFNRYTSLRQVHGAVNRLPFIGATTNTSLALELGRRVFLNSSYGSRPNATHIMLLITDMFSDPGPEWKGLFLGNVSLLNSTTDVQRFLVFVRGSSANGILDSFPSRPSYGWQLPTFERLRRVVPQVVTAINSIGCLPSMTTPGPTTTTTTTTPASTTTSTSTTTTTTTTSPLSSPPTTSSTTTTSTTTTTTSPASTTPEVWEGVFGVATTSSFTSRGSVNYTTMLANVFGAYRSGTFSARRAGNYYVEVCASAQRSTAVEMLTAGGYPTVTYLWMSTSHNGRVSSCRGGVVRLSTNVPINMRLNRGVAYSDDKRQTSWSLFDTVLVALPRSLIYIPYHRPFAVLNEPIPFQEPTVSPDPFRFNSANHIYTCTTAGPYFFAVTAAIPPGVPTRVQVSYSNFATGELMRMTSTTNRMTTLSGKFLMTCARGIQVSVNLVVGQVSPGPNPTLEQSLLTFTAFQYSVAGRSTAWSVYRESNCTSSASDTTLAFDAPRSAVLTVGNVRWDGSSNEVTIRVAGNYYVYVSGGAQPNTALGLTVQRNNDGVFGVYRTATNFNGVDSLGYGAVIYLDDGDRLKVVVERNTACYGSSLRHTSFFGFLIF